MPGKAPRQVMGLFVIVPGSCSLMGCALPRMGPERDERLSEMVGGRSSACVRPATFSDEFK